MGEWVSEEACLLACRLTPPRAAQIEVWVFALNGEQDPGDPKYRAGIRRAVGESNFVDMSQMSGVQVDDAHGSTVDDAHGSGPEMLPPANGRSTGA